MIIVVVIMMMMMMMMIIVVVMMMMMTMMMTAIIVLVIIIMMMMMMLMDIDFSCVVRFHDLSVLLRQRDTELELLKKRYGKLQTRYDEVVQEFEKRLDIAKDKEMQLIRVSAM